MKQMITIARLQPGWHISLHGELQDLISWSQALSDLAEALVVVEMIGPPMMEDGVTPLAGSDLRGMLLPDYIVRTFYLTNDELSQAQNESSARVIGYRIVDSLNLKMAMNYFTLPLSSGGVTFVDPDGGRNHYGSFETEIIANKSPSAPFTPSEYKCLSKREKVKALLLEYNHASDWWEIYKVLEFCSHLVGSRDRLKKLCSGKIEYDNLRAFSNRSRHALSDKKQGVSFGLFDGIGIMRKVIRVALANAC